MSRTIRRCRVCGSHHTRRATCPECARWKRDIYPARLEAHRAREARRARVLAWVWSRIVGGAA